MAITNQPLIPPEPDLGDLSDSEKVYRSCLTSCRAAFNPGWKANSSDSFSTKMMRIHRGEGTLRKFYGCDFFLECWKLRQLPEVSAQLKRPNMVNLVLLLQRVAYAPRKATKHRIYETGKIASEAFTLGEESVVFFRYLRAVQANTFPFEPYSHDRSDRNILWDIGLHPFGGIPEEFESYYSARLQEHQHVLGHDRGALAFKHFFRTRLRKMLQHLDSGLCLFRSDYFRNMFEMAARANIVNKLKEIG